MKTTFICPATIRTFALAALLGGASAHADTYTWSGGGSDDGIFDNANWVGNSAPPSDGTANVVFTDQYFTSGHADLTPTLNTTANFQVSTLTFAGGSSFTIGTTMARGLDIGEGLNQNSAAAQTITIPTYLTDNQTWTFAATAGALNFTGNGQVNLQSYNLTFAAQGSNTLNGTITGSGGLIANGPGTITLTGNNIFSGSVTLAGGTLSLQNTGAIGTGGTITFAGGTLQYSSSNAVDYSSRFSTADEQAFNIDTNGRNVTFATSLESSGGSLTKLGAGTLTLTATNVYSSTTTVSGGTLAINAGGDLSSGSIYVRQGATLAISGMGNVATNVSPEAGGFLTVDGSKTVAANATLGGAGTLSTSATTIGNGGAGTFTQTGGSFTTNGMTLYLGQSTGGNGTYSLAGATSSLSTGAVTIGLYGTGSMTQSAGSFTTNGGTFSLGQNAGASGTYSLTGGTLSTGSVYIGSVDAGGNRGGVGTFSQSGGTFNNNNSDLQIGYSASSPGSYTLSGGTLSTGNAYVGYSGAGTFTQTGGSFNVSYTRSIVDGGPFETYLGLAVGDQPGSNGTYNLSGTGSLSAGNIFVGFGGTGTFTQTGGTTTLLTTVNGEGTYLDIGYNAGSVGTYSLQGGTLSTPSISVGDSGTGTLTLSGGTATVATTVDLATASGSTGTVNLDTGGLLQVGGGVDGKQGTSTFNFNGGTLQATASSTTFLHDLSKANVQTGGAKIDTNGFNATVAQPLVHDPSLGTTIDGGLTKNGAGTLTLTAANTYTGATTISAGTLTLGNANALQDSTLVTSSTGGGVAFAGSINNFNLGGLSGDGKLVLTDASSARATLVVGSNNASTTYSGALSGVGGLTKTGSGTLTLTGNSAYQDTTRVDGGTLTLANGGSLSSGYVYIGDSASGSFSQTAGTFSTNATFNLGQTAGVTGTYSLSGATSILSTRRANIGNFGTGTFTQTAGTFTTNNNEFDLGYAGNVAGSTYSLSGTGSSLSTGTTYIGNNGSGTFNQSGGSFTTSGTLYIAYQATSSSAYNLSGGSVSTGAVSVGSGGSGTITQTGGTFTTNGAAITLAGSPPVNGYPGGIGTYTLSGGTLTVGSVQGSPGTSTFNFNGGTLQASTGTPTFFQGLTMANVQAGGAKIGSNGFNVTVAQALVSGTSSGTTDGGLTKLGAGTLTLTGTNTYTGATTISAGTLLAGNTSGSATGTGAVTVQSGGTLGGSGTILGAVTVQSGGTLAPGELAVSRLTLGSNLALNSGSTLAIALGGTTAGTGYDQVQLAGQLTLGGNLSVSTVNGFKLSVGQTFVILDDTGTTLTSGTFANTMLLGTMYTDAAGDQFLVNYAYSNDGGANDVSLTVESVVPEPSSWTSVVLGGALLAFVTARHRRQGAEGTAFGCCPEL